MPADVELGRLNHIGIVVPGAEHDTVVDSLVRLFAGEINQSGDDEELNGRWSWVRASSGLVLEVCSPFENAASAMTRFLERTGGGLHHVSFDSDDITACRAAARERGATLVGESDDHAGWAEFFVRPRETGYALFHWMQPVAERAFEALELGRSQR
ncbi:VOC family protein [Amycolatopsis sp. cg13]|uniref:VOC family protein n=1 Tax=Amycolatopsis sp. cg13 TaxID=3238807 RepID=UPI00352617AE